MEEVMFLQIPENGYWLNAQGIKIVNEKYKSKYLGYFAMPTREGGWTDEPHDLFYVENPDRSKGHSNYFALFYSRSLYEERGPLMITNGENCFKTPMLGVMSPDGEVHISRYRHHMHDIPGGFIDGGRDYIRLGGEACRYPKVEILIVDGEFLFEKKENN